MNTHAKVANVVMLSMGLVIGLVSAFNRGFWPVAPLLVIASVGLVMFVLPPIPKDQRGLTWWAAANLVGLIVALLATWFESVSLLVTGLVLLAIAIAAPSLQRRS